MYQNNRFTNTLILSLSYLVVNLSAFSQFEHRSTEDATEEQLATLNWIKKHDVKLNQLPLANQNNIYYECDSTLFIKEMHDDTIVFWRYGTQAPIDTILASERLNHPQYGKKMFFKEIHYDGKINLVNLMPYKYQIKNDSLFQLETFYTISFDSLMNIFGQFSKSSEEEIMAYNKIIDDNSYEKFKLIFHPEALKNDQTLENINNDKIELIHQWECKNLKYYKIKITNNWGGFERTDKVFFDENYEWINYIPCEVEGDDCLR